MITWRQSVAAGLLLGLAACSTTTAPLVYQPDGTEIRQPAEPAIGQVAAVDQRGEDDPAWYGAIRGGFGNPLKVLRAQAPIADVVASAFRTALAQRGMLAAPGQGQLDLTLTVTKFESDQVARREAEITLAAVLTSRANGAQIYRDTAAVDIENGSLVTLDAGIFGSVGELQTLVQQALSRAVDQIVDKPAFAAALRGAGAAASPSS